MITHRLSASGSTRLSVDTGEGAGERASAQECALTCEGDERAHQGDAAVGLASAAGGPAMLGLKAVVPSQVVPVGGRVQVLPGTLHALCALTCCCAFRGPKHAAASRSIKPGFAQVVCWHCIRTRELSYLMGAKRYWLGLAQPVLHGAEPKCSEWHMGGLRIRRWGTTS
jgi:hypothetical protein